MKITLLYHGQRCQLLWAIFFQHENMLSLLHRIHEEKYCGHCFQSVRFACVENANQTLSLFSRNVSHRFLIGLTLKCVSDPQRALFFEREVHHIMQPRCELEQSESLPL